MYSTLVKPILDRLISLIGLLVLSPFVLLIMVLLSISQRGNPFFFQERPGKNGRLFKIIKFKTMNDQMDAQGVLLPDGERLTNMGRFIRRTSLDEIPQLINVLKGDMSLIGPRPLLTEYLPLYTKEQARRHEVRPGITGWAQVNGRNAITWEQKFEYDVWYVENQSFWLDMKILFMTVSKVFKREGISAEGEATMQEFKGNHQL